MSVGSDTLRSRRNAQTDQNGNISTDQTYYAFGSQQDSGPVATDHKFMGQKLDGSGLMYYNARYYDPAIGQFVSPDTLVPDPENVLAYNRYMYALGNPLKYTDPSGHDTSKPKWWPPYLPYVYDLPDEPSYEGLVEWAGENNVPTAVGSQMGGEAVTGFGLHSGVSGEFQATFNWLSGEFMWSFNDSAGARLGTPTNGAGLYLGGSAHYNASSTRSLEEASLFGAVDGGADALARVGVQGSFSRAVEFGDDNGNEHFDLLQSEGAFFSPVKDPIFGAPIDSLSVNLVGGFDITPNAVEGGFSTGVTDTNRLVRIDTYKPFRYVFSAFGVGGSE